MSKHEENQKNVFVQQEIVDKFKKAWEKRNLDLEDCRLEGDDIIMGNAKCSDLLQVGSNCSLLSLISEGTSTLYLAVFNMAGQKDPLSYCAAQALKDVHEDKDTQGGLLEENTLQRMNTVIEEGKDEKRKFVRKKLAFHGVPLFAEERRKHTETPERVASLLPGALRFEQS